jgi:large subunit ribosomal protein L32
MAVPKKRHTKSQRNRRRSHLALKGKSFLVCQKCGESVLPHHTCMNCGFYKGREVVNVLAKLEKKERKKKAKELAEQEHEQRTKKPLSAEELSKKS